jgi:hypothetical protein
MCSAALGIPLASRVRADPDIMGLKISLPYRKNHAVLKLLGVALQEFRVYKGWFTNGRIQ